MYNINIYINDGNGIVCVLTFYYNISTIFISLPTTLQFNHYILYNAL